MKGTAVHDTDPIKASTTTEQIEPLTAALPDVVDQAMRTTLPERYTPELAQQIAAGIVAHLHAPRPLTAAQRGPEWMLRYGCTPDCIGDHDQPCAPEWHTAARIETVMRDLDPGLGNERAAVPFLAAQAVVTNDKAQAYGRETHVWLDYGTTTAELSPAEARQTLEAMREFLTRFEAVVAHAEESSADDFAGDPEIARLDREADSRRIRANAEAGA